MKGLSFENEEFKFQGAVDLILEILCISHVHFYYRLYIIHSLRFTIEG